MRAVVRIETHQVKAIMAAVSNEPTAISGFTQGRERAFERGTRANDQRAIALIISSSLCV